MKKPQKFAVFDVDGTIFRSSLFIELLELMIEKGILDESVRSGYTKEHKAWWERKGSYQDYIGAMIDTFNKNIKGVFYGDFADTAKEVVESQVNRTYRYTRDLVKKLKKDGYYLIAISHSPKTILDQFCPSLGFDKVYGVIYEIDKDDLLTGEMQDKYMIMNKANILQRVIENEGLTIEGSIAVGDTDSDITMLEMVENPICFNPNSELYKRAQASKWEVVVERKDVVYYL